MGETARDLTIPFKVWERTGITEHLGGIDATVEMAGLCHISSGQLVLDVGCGTGYTACLLARRYEAKVIGIDINPQILKIAKARAKREHMEGTVELIVADAHRLPFRDGVFDRAVAESVLIFCDKPIAVGEIFRAVKHGGYFCDNEMTFTKPPSNDITYLLSIPQKMGITPMMEGDWVKTYKEAGFHETSHITHQISFLRQLFSHIRIDGLRKYASSVVIGITDKTLRSMFFNARMLKALLHFASNVRYGLYINKKD